MHFLAWLLASFVLVGLVIQVWQSLHLLRKFKVYRPLYLDDAALPKCAVVLCLRGCDPGLKQNLENLLNQDYPDFHVFFVFDNDADPAATLVREILSQRNCSRGSIRIIPPRDSCSLLANNHGTILPELASQFPVLALIDADAVIWPAWLRTLVAPLVDSPLTMVYGNRWYMPGQPTLAALTRFIWNYGSVQQMVFYRYPWGGCLAMKAELAAIPEFRERLQQSFGNDTLFYSLARSAGMKMDFHPGMILVNREQIGFSDFYNWMSRQIVYSRLYHPSWPMLFATGLTTGIVIGMAFFINLINIWFQDWGSVAALSSMLVLYWLVWMNHLFQMDRRIGRMISQRGEATRWRTVGDTIKIILIAPLVPFVFMAGLVYASTMKSVRWRDTDYEIKGPFDVRVLNYHPSQAVATGNESLL